MFRIRRKLSIVLTVIVFILFLGGVGIIYSKTTKDNSTENKALKYLPLYLSYVDDTTKLERPPAVFYHDKHTEALKKIKKEDCAVCHILEVKDKAIKGEKVKVFKYPKSSYDPSDKDSIMEVFHKECTTCHEQMVKEGYKSGPPVGLCAKCHIKEKKPQKVKWDWKPIFDYARHNRHVEANEKKCEACHHKYDEKQKKLVYEKSKENSCRACHKLKDEGNSRSMKNVAHASCMYCHYERLKKSQKSGPTNCYGCHGEHKQLTLHEIELIPRLLRGQKDVIDITITDSKTGQRNTKLSSMKIVPFNHKAHEYQGQFCNSCHHYSLEKCSNCHLYQGNSEKGGGVSYLDAFHKSNSKLSCAGCHQTAKLDKKCAGCHQWLTEELPKSSCKVCHRGTSKGKPIEIPLTSFDYSDKEKIPDTVKIDVLEKEFEPVELPHLKQLLKLVTISNNSSLARYFHATNNYTLCCGCHHQSEFKAEVKVPKCSSCHSTSVGLKDLGKPHILAAYHRQCMECHEAMQIKPTALECDKCHKPKKNKEKVKVTIPFAGKAK